MALETPTQTHCFCLDKVETMEAFPPTRNNSDFNSSKSYLFLKASQMKCNCSSSPRWKLWPWGGAEDSFDGTPQRHLKALGDVQVSRTINIQTHLWNSSYLALTRGFLRNEGCGHTTVCSLQLLKSQRGLKRHFPAHWDCHNTPGDTELQPANI